MEGQKLTKEPHDNISNISLQNDVNPVNYEPINLGTGLTQDSVHLVFEGKIDHFYTENPITYESKEEVEFLGIDESETVDLLDKLDLWESVEIPDIPTRITYEQIIEEFMLEEEIESQGIDECKMVKLQDK